MIAMIPQRWHFDMRCAANANDAPIALEPGLIFCLLAMAKFVDICIYGYNVETKLFDSASKSKSTSFHIAPVAFFVLSVRLCSLIKPLRFYPIWYISIHTDIYVYICVALWGQWTEKAHRLPVHWKSDSKCVNTFLRHKKKVKTQLEGKWSSYRIVKLLNIISRQPDKGNIYIKLKKKTCISM